MGAASSINPATVADLPTPAAIAAAVAAPSAATIAAAVAANGKAQNFQSIFAKSANFTVPANVSQVTVTCVGGGCTYGTAGGYIKRTLTVTPGAVIPVVVGAAGVPAGIGGTSSFGSLLNAFGGIGLGAAISTPSTSYGSTGAITPPSGLAEHVGVSEGGLAQGKSMVLPSVTPILNAATAYPYKPCPTALGSTYVILGSDGRTTFTSTDGGFTWATNTNALASAVGMIVVIGSYFVAIPTASGTTTYKSTDGITWTTSGALPSSGNWSNLSSNGTVAVATISGTTNAASTTDGLTWTAQTLPLAATQFQQGGSYFFCSTGTTVYYSATGATGSWTACTGLSTGMTYYLYYINGNYILVGSSTSTVCTFYYSTNGTAWSTTTVTYPSFANTLSICVVGTTLYVVLYSGATTVIITTSNGSVFNVISQMNGYNVFPFIYGAYGVPALQSPSVTGRPFSANSFNQIAVGNGRYVVPVVVTAAATVAWNGLVMFSDGFVGGNAGGAVSASMATFHGFAPGSAVATAAGVYPVAGQGSPEGFCKGGSANYETAPNFGDGGSPLSPGGQGVVIVEWVA